MATISKDKVLNQLKKDILQWQGFNPPESHTDRIGLGPVEKAFPNGIFPRGNIHEFISMAVEQDAASSGFIGGLLASLLKNGGICVWISTNHLLFPPSLTTFGVTVDSIIFIHLKGAQDILWTMEEALKCKGLAAVVVEGREMDFLQSRRLQLAVEKSKVTGFILRRAPNRMTTTACAARWRITPVSSEPKDGMPGVGFPRWEVELLKVRNGNPGKWIMEWSAGRFVPLAKQAAVNHFLSSDRKIG